MCRRARVAQALTTCGDTSVVLALIEALKDPSPWVGVVAGAPGRYTGLEAVPLLMQRSL